MRPSNKFITGFIIFLSVTTIVFAMLFYRSQAQLRVAEQMVANQKMNSQVLAFAQMFFDKVLAGSKEVSFDDRLALENSVRALNDRAIFDAWQKFTAAKNQAEVQADFYSLFNLLLKKM